jgi:hypothetical protein
MIWLHAKEYLLLVQLLRLVRLPPLQNLLLCRCSC